MKKRARIRTYSILLSTVLSMAGLRQASAALGPWPRTCADIFAAVPDYEKTVGSKVVALEKARQQRQTQQPKRDEMDGFKLEHLEKLAAMTDEEFERYTAISNEWTNTSVPDYIKDGKTLDEALISAFEYSPEHAVEVKPFFNEAGYVRLSALPRVSLSLENGRQKLDFARIHFSKRDSKLSEEVFKDYLAIAEKYRGLRLLVMTDRPQTDIDAILKAASADAKKRIRIVRTTDELWIWAQDGSKPVDLPRETSEFASPRYAAATQDLDVKQVVTARGLAIPIRRGSTFQGGDIIVGDRNVFVGEAEMKMMAMTFRIPDSEVIDVLSAMFQKPVLPAYIKTSKYGGEEWSFHIDMDMVLAVNRHTNKEVALIRSPEALLGALADHQFTQTPTDAEVLAVRDRILERYRTGYFGKSLATGSREFIETLAHSDAYALRLTIVKGRLFKRTIHSYGYEVRDMPTFGEAQAKGRSFFYGTNAVLTDGLAIVPSNKMPELDRMIRSIYEDLGYDVIQARSAADTICQQGGIRCVTETYRKPYLTRFPERVTP